MDINLNYSHAETIGYGRLGVKLHAALQAKGVTVYDHYPVPVGAESDPFGDQGRESGLAGTVCWV